jgi:hypothetical protein
VAQSLLLTLVLALAWGVLSAGAAFAGPDEGSFASAVNAARSGHGVAPMSLQADLSAVARAQAQRCADADELFHNPTLGSDVSGWQVVGENVGVGGDWRSIEDAFMASPEHRANILDPVFTQFGVGTAVGKDGSLWVSQVFRAPGGAVPSVSGSGSGSAVGGSTPSSASTWTAPPPPSPEEVLRGKIAQARKAVRSGKPSDPLRSAVDFATVMSTVGR